MEIKNANELGWVNAFETPLLSSFDKTIMAIYIGSEKSTFMNFGCNGINTCYQKFQLKITSSQDNHILLNFGFNILSLQFKLKPNFKNNKEKFFWDRNKKLFTNMDEFFEFE